MYHAIHGRPALAKFMVILPTSTCS
jgi:hypothetical protein